MNHASDTIHIGVIGLGRMGRIYAETVSRATGAVLYAAADASAKAQAAARATYDIPHFLSDIEDVLSLPNLDAVIIATPTHLHHTHVIAAARAGKAIFSEKPLALTPDHTHAALDAVAVAGVPLQVGFMRRFDEAYHKAKDMIASGAIGEPVTIKCIGRDPFCPDPRFADPAVSGGLILDMGIHDFDLARWLMGDEVARVSAEGTCKVCTDLQAVDDFDNAVINLRFQNGGLGNVEVSRNAFYGYDIRTEVLGSEGAINIGGYQQTPVLYLSRSGAQHDIVPYLHDRFGAAYRTQIQHFIDHLRQGTPPTVTGADALAAFEISLAATRSARTGQPVLVGGRGN